MADNKKMGLNNKIKFALFGHGFHLCYFVEALIERGFPAPVIITHPKKLHDRDIKLLGHDDALYRNVFDVVNKYNIKILEVDNANQRIVLNFLHNEQCTAGFSLSCRSILRKNIIDFFDEKIFNIHPTYLPCERGGGTFSWRILNGVNEISATIHRIDEGIDSGNILLQTKESLPGHHHKPYDFLISTNLLYTKLIDIFLDKIPRIMELDGIKQDNSKSTYFPRLITEINGIIDWSLSGVFIERTIRAFSYPYSGSLTYVNGKRIFIIDSFFEESDHNMHPLMYGKVVGYTSKNLPKVVVKDGYLYVSSIKTSEGEVRHPKEIINCPSQLYSGMEELEMAKSKTMKISQVNFE
mgnify:FL=1